VVERLHDAVDELLGEPRTAMMDGSGDETEVDWSLHRLQDHRFINRRTGFVEEGFGHWDEGLDCWSWEPSLSVVL